LPDAARILLTRSTAEALLQPSADDEAHDRPEARFFSTDLRTFVDALRRGSRLAAQRDELNARLAQSLEALARAERALRDSQFELEQVVRQRTGELEIANDELRDLNRRLGELAVRDNLTGLFNRRTLREHLGLEVARSQRYERQFAVIFIDIDDFKQVNDRHGHAVGDEVLRVMARLLHEGPHGLRRSDFTARFGGEEFCAILPETVAIGAEVKAERLRKTIESHGWARECPVDRVTVSIGVAGFPEHGRDPDSVLEAADRAMQQAKQAGKNRVAVLSR
jgi:diguanylate cyclase (GGDEF)-like protein